MAPVLDPGDLEAAQACLGQFLAGQELAASAPSARMPHAGGIARVDQIRELSPARLELQEPVLLAWRPDLHRPVGWFAVRGPRPVTLAVGFVRDGGWAIGWATLAEAAAEWSWADGEREALAELPYARGARNWVEAAYERLYGLQPAEPQLSLPEAAFGCAGSTTCCRIDYRIEVDPAYQHVLDALPELGGVQLPAGRGGQLEVKQDGQPCRFLTPQGRCRIHELLDRPLFPPCALFPFSFARTPDGLAIATSAICGTARANLGPRLSDQPEELRRRAALSPVLPLQTPVYRLAHGQVVSWSAFRTAEERVLDLLARADLPLAERLWLGSWAVEGREPEGAPEALPAEQQAAARAFLGPFLAAVDWSGQALAPTWRCTPTLVPVLRNLLFSKVLSFHFDLATAHNLAIALALTALHAEAAAGGPPSEPVWQALGHMFMHGGGMGFLLGDDARDRRDMLSNPAFGRWLLGLTRV